MFTGHIKIARGLAYMFLQLCGACFGILLVVGSQLLVAETLSIGLRQVLLQQS